MKPIDIDSQEITILLKPEGRPLGRKALSASVYTEFVGDARLRFAQELCGLVGGTVVYVETAKAGAAVQTVPVAGWHAPDMRGTAGCVFDLVESAARNGCSVSVFGADRARWTLDVRCSQAAHDSVDNMSDRVREVQADATVRPALESNGTRREF